MPGRRCCLPLLSCLVLLALSMTVAAHEPVTPRTDPYGDPLPAGAVARLGTTRFRHLGQHQFLGFAPHSNTLVSLAEDGTLHFVEPPEGKLVRRLPLSTTEGQRLTPHSFNQALSGSRRTVAAYVGDVVLLDLTTGKATGRIPNAEVLPQVGGGVHLSNFAMHLSHDGGLLVVSGQVVDGATQIAWIDAGKGKRLQQAFSKKDSTFTAVAISRDASRTCAVEMDQQQGKAWLRTWEAAGSKEVHIADLSGGGQIGRIQFLPDGKTLVVQDHADGSLRLVDSTNGKELRRFEEKGNPMQSFALAPDGKTLFGVSVGEVRQWNVADGKEVRLLKLGPHAGESPQAALSSDGKLLALSGSYHLTVWDTATGKQIGATRGHPAPVASLAFTPTGQQLVSAALVPPALVWDVAAGREVRRLEGRIDNPAQVWRGVSGQGVQALVSADGKGFGAVWPGRPAMLWSPDLAAPPRSLGPVNGSLAMALSPDGKLLAAASQDGAVLLYDAASGKEMGRLLWANPPRPEEGFNGVLSVLTFSRDGRTLGAGGWVTENGAARTRVRLWELTSRDQRLQVEWVHKSGADEWSGMRFRRWGRVSVADGTISVHFTPDGRLLAIGRGNIIYLWDLVAGKEVRQLAGPGVSARAMAFRPDGKLLAAGCQDGSIRLWRLPSGEVLRDLPAHGLQITALAFAPDGKLLASGSLDSTVLLWDVDHVLRDVLTPSARLTNRQAEALWLDLVEGDAGKAFRAVNALVQSPDLAVPLLQEKLRPVPLPEAKRLQRLAADLGDARYAVRQKASRELEDLAELARPVLQGQLALGPSAEVRRRVELLLRRLEGPVNSSGLLAALRGIEALERIGTPEARRVLSSLAGGAPGHRITEEARIALGRLDRP